MTHSQTGSLQGGDKSSDRFTSYGFTEVTGASHGRQVVLSTPGKEVKKGGWTDQEDAILLVNHAKLGNRWTSISKLLENRTDNAVKNRFASLKKSFNCAKSKRSKVRVAHQTRWADNSDLNESNNGNCSVVTSPSRFFQPEIESKCPNALDFPNPLFKNQGCSANCHTAATKSKEATLSSVQPECCAQYRALTPSYKRRLLDSPHNYTPCYKDQVLATPLLHLLQSPMTFRDSEQFHFDAPHWKNVLTTGLTPDSCSKRPESALAVFRQ